MILQIFWQILGFGICVPAVSIVIFNLVAKAQSGDNYQLNVTQLGKVYLLAVVGLAIALGIK
jgi:hypothetical protein